MQTKTNLFLPILCVLFIVILLLSNITASNVFYSNTFFSLSAAEFLFPLTYIVNDLLCEFYSFRTVNKITIIGLIITMTTTIFLFLTTFLPTDYEEYQIVFGFSSGGIIGITFASFFAFAIGTLTNSLIMSKLKSKDKNKKFFKRAIISSIFAEFFDSLIFSTFCCIFAPNIYFWDKLISLVITITIIKTCVEIFIFPLTNYLRKIAIQKKWIEFNNEISSNNITK